MPFPARPLRVLACLPLLLAAGCGRRPADTGREVFSTSAQELSAPAGLDAPTWTLLGGRVVVIGDSGDADGRVLSAWQLDLANGGWNQAATLPTTLDPTRLLWSSGGAFLPPATPDQGGAWLLAGTGSRLEAVPLPPLPVGHRATAATFIGDSVFVAAANGAGTRLLAHSPIRPGTWDDHGAAAPTAAEVVTLATQGNGERPHLYVLARTVAGPTLSAYEPQRRQWLTLPAPPTTILEGRLAPVGVIHLHAFGPVAGPGSSGALHVLNTVTRVWTPAFALPESGRFVAAAGSGTRLQALAVAGDGRATLVTADYLQRAEGLHGWDYAVILLFIGGLVTMGVLNSSRFRSAESYFRGGRKIPWLAAALSVVATGQSATSFISLPSRGFATNWQFGLVPLTNVFGAFIMGRFFVRFFVRLNITSAYEYLQVRFSPLVRSIGSINYLAYELTRISLLILVPAVAVSAVTRIDLNLAILLMGTIATLYTTLGGLEGVVWADVVQILIKITAIILVVILVFAQLEGSLWELAGTAWREGKLKAVDWSFDLTRDTIWALILFWLTDGLKSYVANQTIIQRFISTRDERTAQRSIYASAVVGTLIFWTFLLAGTGLFLFYQQNPGRLDLTMDKPDAVFPWFIVFELPPGVAGFLITALITAALSSLYGALNSTSTVMVTDFYRRFATAPSDTGALRLGRRLTVLVGVLATGLSLLLAGLASRSLIEQTLSVIGLFGGGLGGLFLVGMLTTRVSARAALTGFVVSAVVQYIVSRHTPLHWLTYMFTGMGSCFVTAWLAGFVWPERKPLDGLTVHTCAR